MDSVTRNESSPKMMGKHPTPAVGTKAIPKDEHSQGNDVSNWSRRVFSGSLSQRRNRATGK